MFTLWLNLHLEVWPHCTNTMSDGDLAGSWHVLTTAKVWAFRRKIWRYDICAYLLRLGQLSPKKWVHGCVCVCVRVRLSIYLDIWLTFEIWTSRWMLSGKLCKCSSGLQSRFNQWNTSKLIIIILRCVQVASRNVVRFQRTRFPFPPLLHHPSIHPETPLSIPPSVLLRKMFPSSAWEKGVIKGGGGRERGRGQGTFCELVLFFRGSVCRRRGHFLLWSFPRKNKTMNQTKREIDTIP